MVEERRDDDLASKDTVASTLKYQYVWGVRYIDAPVCRDEDKSDGSGGEPDGDCIDADDEHLYYTQDANFNVTALVDGSDGSVVERYMYSPYGEVEVLDADWSADADGKSDVDNAILYCGYYHDWETGLYHVRHRYYHPPLGRWTTRDPASVVGSSDGRSARHLFRAGANLYTYTSGVPTSRVDPEGLEDLMVGSGVAIRPDGTAVIDPTPGSGYPSDPAQREEIGWQVQEYNHTDRSSIGKVELQVTPLSHWSSGSVDIHIGNDETHTVFLAPERGAWTRLVNNVTRARHGNHGGFQKRERSNSVYWGGQLKVWVKPPSSGMVQVCPDYWWEVTIKNLCCESGDLRVKTSGMARQKAQYTIPPSATHAVPVGQSKTIDNVRLAAVFTLKTPGWFRTEARAAIGLSCEP